MYPIDTGLDAVVTPKAPVQAVLFDVYGTLFISRAGDIGAAKEEAARNIDAIAELCARHGITMPVSPMLDAFFECIGTIKRALRDGKGIQYPEVVIEDIWSSLLGVTDISLLQSFALEYEMIVNPVYPMPHLQELLSACKRGKVVMGIISNAQFYTPYLFVSLLGQSLTELGFREDLLLFSYMLGYCKPSHEPFERAAQVLKESGIDATNTLYVGNDMRKDIAPSAAAGFQTALFAGDARSLNLREEDQSCAHIRPDIIITDLAQIIECLAS